MKICFITGSVFGLGGVQRVTSVLANGLCKSHEVKILCTSSKFNIDREMYNLNENIDIEINSEIVKRNFYGKIFYGILKKINKKTGILNNKIFLPITKRVYIPYDVQEKFVNYINKNNFDIVIGVEGEFSILLGAINHKIKAKSIGWQHNSYEAYWKTKNKYYWKQEKLYAEYLKMLDKYVVLTEHDKKLIKSIQGLEAIRIYNPLSFKSNEKSDYTNKNIICVSRLVEQQKGLDMLLKAYSEVLKRHPDWALSIVGDGPDKQKIENYINELNLNNNVKIKDSTNDIIKEYISASIFVSASRWEGFGLVITEAMECGLPVVAFNNSGPKEIINDNIDGLLVERNDIKALENAINTLIDNPETIRRIGNNSLKRANEFSIEKVVREWNIMFQSLME